jgi:hypothetical protein
LSKEKIGFFLKFEKKSFLEFRSKLFKDGLTPNELFSQIVELAICNDLKILELIEEIKKNKLEELKEGRFEGKYTSNNIYDVIENKLKK